MGARGNVCIAAKYLQLCWTGPGQSRIQGLSLHGVWVPADTFTISRALYVMQQHISFFMLVCARVHSYSRINFMCETLCVSFLCHGIIRAGITWSERHSRSHTRTHTLSHWRHVECKTRHHLSSLSWTLRCHVAIVYWHVIEIPLKHDIHYVHYKCPNNTLLL